MPQFAVHIGAQSLAVGAQLRCRRIAFADVRSIGGLSGSVNLEISQKVCALLGDTLGIPANRVYLSFNSSAAADWGWDSRTFG